MNKSIETLLPTYTNLAKGTTKTELTPQSERAKYRFKLNFPARPFTIHSLMEKTGRKTRYITLRKRIEKAVEGGELVVVGKAPREGRGRPADVFAKAPIAAKVVAKSAAAENAALRAELKELRTKIAEFKSLKSKVSALNGEVSTLKAGAAEVVNYLTSTAEGAKLPSGG